MKEIFTSETFQMLSDRIDTFMEEHDVYDYDNVTIVVEKVKDETDPAGYIWKATLAPKDTASTLKDMLVEEHGYVNFFVSSEEIKMIAVEEQRELTAASTFRTLNGPLILASHGATWLSLNLKCQWIRSW